MDKNYATFLLNKTKEDYNKISQRFDSTRDYLPNDIKDLGQYINQGERVLDIGCGNGRLSQLISAENYIGIDISDKLIEIAKKKYPDKRFVLSEPLKFPFENQSFDIAICLAVLHHIPSKQSRAEFLKEIKRILKPNGKLILTVWDLQSSKKAIKLFLKYTLLKLVGKTKVDFKDIFYPWKNSKGEEITDRYIHIFSLKELQKLVEQADFEIIKTMYVKRSKKERNLLIIAKARL